MKAQEEIDTKLLFAWIVALTASLGALFIGEVLGKAPCSLCWQQRIFMFPIAILLALGLWWNDRAIGRYTLALALPGCRFLANSLIFLRNVVKSAETLAFLRFFACSSRE